MDNLLRFLIVGLMFIPITAYAITPTLVVNDNGDQAEFMFEVNDVIFVFYTEDTTNVLWKYSDDEGVTWSVEQTDFASGTLRDEDIAVVQADAGTVTVMYFTNSGGLDRYWSKIGTITGTSISWGSPNVIRTIADDDFTGYLRATSTTNDDIHLMIFWDNSDEWAYHMEKSTDNGVTWTNKASDLALGRFAGQTDIGPFGVTGDDLILTYTKKETGAGDPDLYWRVFNHTTDSFGTEQTIIDFFPSCGWCSQDMEIGQKQNGEGVMFSLENGDSGSLQWTTWATNGTLLGTETIDEENYTIGNNHMGHDFSTVDDIIRSYWIEPRSGIVQNEDFTSPHGSTWTSTDTSAPYYYRISNDEIQFDIVGSSSQRIYTNLETLIDIESPYVLDDTFALRFSINFDEFCNTCLNNHMFVGVSDRSDGDVGTSYQDWVGWKWKTGNPARTLHLQYKHENSFGSDNYALFTDFVTTGTTYYMELLKTPNDITGNIYSDSNYSTLLETGNVVLPIPFNGFSTGDQRLKWAKMTTWSFNSGDQPLSGKIDDWLLSNGNLDFTNSTYNFKGMDYDGTIWGDVYEVIPGNTFDVPSATKRGFEIDSFLWLETSLKDIMFGFVEPSEFLDPPETPDEPICTDISSNQLVFDWTEDQTGEDLQGYGIQTSLDDVTFTNQIENTLSTFSAYLVTGLDQNTDYYLQWRNQFFNGTSGDWSTSIQCTTLQGGGGGAPTPIEDVICTPAQIQDPNHECFIAPDECNPITSFEIIGGNTNNVNIGQTSNNNLEALWSGNDNLRIDEIVPDETTGIKLAFQQPIEFPPGNSGVTTSNIPYNVENPPTECIDEQTPNCIYQNAEYEIPVRIFGSSCQEDFRVDSTIIVTIRDDRPFDFRLFVLAIIGIFVLFFIIVKRKKKKKKRKKLTAKTRTRSGQIDNKNAKRPNFG